MTREWQEAAIREELRTLIEEVREGYSDHSYTNPDPTRPTLTSDQEVLDNESGAA